MSCEGGGYDTFRLLWSSKNPLHVAFIPKELPPSAEALGVRLQMLDVTEPAGIAPAVEAAVRERARARLVMGESCLPYIWTGKW